MPSYRVSTGVYAIVTFWGQGSGGIANTANASFGAGVVAPISPNNEMRLRLWPFISTPVEEDVPQTAFVLKRYNGSTWVPAVVKHGSGWPVKSFGVLP